MLLWIRISVVAAAVVQRVRWSVPTLRRHQWLSAIGIAADAYIVGCNETAIIPIELLMYTVILLSPFVLTLSLDLKSNDASIAWRQWRRRRRRILWNNNTCHRKKENSYRRLTFAIPRAFLLLSPMQSRQAAAAATKHTKKLNEMALHCE